MMSVNAGGTTMTKRSKNSGCAAGVLLAVLLGCGIVEAASVTLTWDPLGAAQLPPDFKEIEVDRAVQSCTAQGPFQPLLINGTRVTITKPATGSFPTTFTDTTVPNIDGPICYQLRSIDTVGNFSLSNVASKVLNLDPPAALTGVTVGTVTP